MAYDQSCEIFRINKQLCSFSQDGRFLAFANQTNLTIKNTGTFDNYLTFVFPDIIEEIEWSPDSEFVLCYSVKKAIVQIFSVCYPDWKFKLTEGSSGIDNIKWAPDSRHILVIADLKVQISVWSLIDFSIMHIQNLKSSALKGVEFSPNGKNLAVIVSENEQDYIDIFKTKDWRLSRKLICEGLSSIDGVSWSPNSEIMSIWCSISGLAKMILYSTVTESYEGVFHPDDNTISSSSSENNLLNNEFNEKLRGLEMVKWMPSGQLLAVSGHNETVVLLNCLTWNPLLQLRLEPVIKAGNYLIRVFRECIMKEAKDSNRSSERTAAANERHIMEEIGSRPVNIPIVKNEPIIGADPSASSIRVIDIMEFSACGQYLAIRHRVYPESLWIWDIRTNGIDILILQNVISSIKWDLNHPRLLLFTESVHIFEWNPDDVSCLNTPRGLTVLDARWHPSSKLAILCGYNRAIVYRFNNDAS